MKIVGKYTNSFSANIAKGVLAEAGIEAFILNENLIFSAGPVNTDLLAIELVVEDDLYDAATQVLNATTIE